MKSKPNPNLMKNPEPLRGEKLMKTVINKILAHPETWDQSTWHCGTTHCFGGHCQIEAGYKANAVTAARDAQEALGVTDSEASMLFRSSCTLSELYYFAENFNRAGFDCAGFNRAGFNRAGFNRAGFNRAGFNRAGFDCAGFNRAGFDCAGFNRAGFDCAGKILKPFVI